MNLALTLSLLLKLSFSLTTTLTMSYSSNPTASPKEAHFSTSPLPRVDSDNVNRTLLPIQASALHTPTVICLWSKIEALITIDPKGNYPDLLIITDVNPRLATQLHRRIEQVGAKVVRSPFDTTTGYFTIKIPTPIHNYICQ